jgi:hypothetical protein
VDSHDVGLKNTDATYQRAMNFIFHEYIGTLVEIYIDDVVIKSRDITKHLADLRKILECTRKHGLKMNPNKCAFGVSVGQFLGFMVHQRGIEISGKSIDAINKVVAPANKTELQSLIGYQPIQEVLTSAVDTDDWRKKIVDYLKDPYKKVERRIRFQLPSMCSSMMNYIIEL